MQAAHAALEMAKNCLSEKDRHPNLVLIHVKSIKKLEEFIELLNMNNIEYRQFYDLDEGGLTTIATKPIKEDQRYLFRKYQLLRFN